MSAPYEGLECLSCPFREFTTIQKVVYEQSADVQLMLGSLLAQALDEDIQLPPEVRARAEALRSELPEFYEQVEVLSPPSHDFASMENECKGPETIQDTIITYRQCGSAAISETMRHSLRKTIS